MPCKSQKLAGTRDFVPHQISCLPQTFAAESLPAHKFRRFGFDLEICARGMCDKEGP